MMLPIARRNLGEVRRALFWWAFSLVALVGIVMAVWPSVENMADLDSFTADLPESAQQALGFAEPMNTPTGYLNGQLFAYFLPLLLLIHSISRGARTVAGEEEDGRMELTSSLPFSRGRIVTEKAVALAVSVTILTAATLLTLVASAPIFDMDVGVAQLSAATVGSGLVALVGGFGALFIGAATGRSGVALAIPAAYIALTYICASLGPSVAALDGFQYASPIHWAQWGQPLTNGFQWQSLAVLGGTCAVLLSAAILGFRKRDLRLS